MNPNTAHTGEISPSTRASIESIKSENESPNSISIESLLSEKIVSQNIVTSVRVTERTITVHISPRLRHLYTRPDCQYPTIVSRYDSDTTSVQGLGLQGKAVRYVVETIRLSYYNDEGRFRVFTVSTPGFYRSLNITDKFMKKTIYLILDNKLSLRVATEMLYDLYNVETSSQAEGRWKEAEAEGLPSIGQLIQQLNAKKKITQLHLDEYKATGTKNWKLCVKDEHGRLIFSIRLKKRDAWHIKVILRWFRIGRAQNKSLLC